MRTLRMRDRVTQGVWDPWLSGEAYHHARGVRPSYGEYPGWTRPYDGWDSSVYHYMEHGRWVCPIESVRTYRPWTQRWHLCEKTEATVWVEHEGTRPTHSSRALSVSNMSEAEVQMRGSVFLGEPGGRAMYGEEDDTCFADSVERVHLDEGCHHQPAQGTLSWEGWMQRGFLSCPSFASMTPRSDTSSVNTEQDHLTAFAEHDHLTVNTEHDPLTVNTEHDPLTVLDTRRDLYPLTCLREMRDHRLTVHYVYGSVWNTFSEYPCVGFPLPLFKTSLPAHSSLEGAWFHTLLETSHGSQRTPAHWVRNTFNMCTASFKDLEPYHAVTTFEGHRQELTEAEEHALGLSPRPLNPNRTTESAPLLHPFKKKEALDFFELYTGMRHHTLTASLPLDETHTFQEGKSVFLRGGWPSYIQACLYACHPDLVSDWGYDLSEGGEEWQPYGSLKRMYPEVLRGEGIHAGVDPEGMIRMRAWIQSREMKERFWLEPTLQMRFFERVLKGLYEREGSKGTVTPFHYLSDAFRFYQTVYCQADLHLKERFERGGGDGEKGWLGYGEERAFRVWGYGFRTCETLREQACRNRFVYERQVREGWLRQSVFRWKQTRVSQSVSIKPMTRFL